MFLTAHDFVWLKISPRLHLEEIRLSHIHHILRFHGSEIQSKHKMFYADPSEFLSRKEIFKNISLPLKCFSNSNPFYALNTRFVGDIIPDTKMSFIES